MTRRRDRRVTCRSVIDRWPVLEMRLSPGEESVIRAAMAATSTSSRAAYVRRALALARTASGVEIAAGGRAPDGCRSYRRVTIEPELLDWLRRVAGELDLAGASTLARELMLARAAADLLAAGRHADLIAAAAEIGLPWHTIATTARVRDAGEEVAAT